MNVFTVEGRLAIITGGSRGIGLGAARALALSGADVILVGRAENDLARAKKELASLGRKVFTETFDLLDTEHIATWFNDLCLRCGIPDILVNSAGVSRRGPALEVTLEDWDTVMRLNATAMFELSRCFARALVATRRPGRIINVASLMTAAARPGTAPYTASKGAVGQLTKVLAVEWAQYGILVNAIAPGYIDTELNAALISDNKFDSWVKERCPLKRWGTPEDVAWPIVFLASAASAFMTGQVIYVDGGWLATF